MAIRSVIDMLKTWVWWRPASSYTPRDFPRVSKPPHCVCVSLGMKKQPPARSHVCVASVAVMDTIRSALIIVDTCTLVQITEMDCNDNSIYIICDNSINDLFHCRRHLLTRLQHVQWHMHTDMKGCQNHRIPGLLGGEPAILCQIVAWCCWVRPFSVVGVGGRPCSTTRDY